MTAASHRGSELDRSRKKKLIPMYRAAAKKYRPLIGRHSLITCEDGLVIDILWESATSSICAAYGETGRRRWSMPERP